jgi:hypothetical protein
MKSKVCSGHFWNYKLIVLIFEEFDLKIYLAAAKIAGCFLN